LVRVHLPLAQKEMWAIAFSLHCVVAVAFISILVPLHAVVHALYLKSAVFKCKWNASLDPTSPTRRNMKIRCVSFSHRVPRVPSTF
jgi:hypothetical protein